MTDGQNLATVMTWLILSFADFRARNFFADIESSSGSSMTTISSQRMEEILDKLAMHTTRHSTAANYQAIWRKFNRFLVNLDRKPPTWEHRMCLYGAHLVEQGAQSATIKLYFSAIKKVLTYINYKVDDEKLLIHTLSQACRIINDRVRTRLPIYCSLMEMILFEVNRIYTKQPFLCALYQCLYCLAYYGLFRIGELTKSDHTVKACNINIGKNKNKILVILYTSKTHGHKSRPQKVKITEMLPIKGKRFFHPFKLLRKYLVLCGGYKCKNEEFFIFRDRSAVTPANACNVLKTAISKIGLNPAVYDFHSYRIG